MKMLVTGGTGFIGRAVLRQLAGAEHTVRFLARQPAAARVRELAASTGTEVVAGDVLEPDTLKAAIQGMDAVIHLVGIISETRDVTFERLHIEATRNVVGACQRTGVSRYVHMSALGTRPHATSRYHQTKWTAEELVRQSGLNFTIFRPSLIYGPEDHFVNLFARLMRFSPVVPVMGAGTTRLAPIAVEAVAQAFVRSLVVPAANHSTLDLCASKCLTFPQILDTIMRVTGRRRCKVHIPLPVARAQASLLELVYGWLGFPPPLNRDQLIMLQEDNAGNPEPAKTLFGLTEVSFEAGIRKYLVPGGVQPSNSSN
jgi:NADH dehydrogenase